jgi:hypothetical protein
MAGKTVVMVLDQDDPNRGEIKLLADGNEAARLAEDLLESGVDVERIRVFDAVELALKVAHRPVVSLGTGAGEEITSDRSDTFDEPEPIVARTEPAEAEPEEEAEAVAGEPLVRNGVRFSSLFKSDDV